MANIIPPPPRFDGAKRTFALVASQFNAEYVQGLVTHATNEVRQLAPNTALVLYQVPGAFEIPIVVHELASQKKADAIIALAVILKGKTRPAEKITHSAATPPQQHTNAHRW